MSTKSIVIVDDEKDLVDLFREALQSRGYEVYCFTSPILAFEKIRRNPSKFSLLITDYRMPEMDGLSLASKLLELNNNLVIFIISAYDEIDSRFEFIKKPMKIDKLIRRVEECLRQA